MVIPYPDSIVLTIVPEPTQNPNTGEYTAVTGGSETYIFKCRAETNTVGRKIMGRDGAIEDYQFNVYLPRNETVIPMGTDYVLTVKNRVFQGKVLNAFNGQLNTRIWL